MALCLRIILIVLLCCVPTQAHDRIWLAWTQYDGREGAATRWMRLPAGCLDQYDADGKLVRKGDGWKSYLAPTDALLTATGTTHVRIAWRRLDKLRTWHTQ